MFDFLEDFAPAHVAGVSFALGVAAGFFITLVI